jgi:hypothetical protein
MKNDKLAVTIAIVIGIASVRKICKAILVFSAGSLSLRAVLRYIGILQANRMRRGTVFWPSPLCYPGM